MINLTIGNITDDNRVIHKNFNERVTITGEINYPCDEVNPEIIVSRETISSSDNYVYIPYFSRYYYINNVVHNGKTKILNLSVDVLKTYANELQKCEVTVIRHSDKPTYITDNKLPIDSTKFYIEGINFPNSPFGTSIASTKNILLGVI